MTAATPKDMLDFIQSKVEGDQQQDRVCTIIFPTSHERCHYRIWDSLTGDTLASGCDTSENIVGRISEFELALGVKSRH